jgi:hypothetical protein
MATPSPDTLPSKLEASVEATNSEQPQVLDCLGFIFFVAKTVVIPSIIIARRGAADRGEHREAAGVVAQALVTVPAC